MKLKYETKKVENEGNQCSLCAAQFEIWLNNSKMSEEKKEKISEHLLSYCPACAREDEKKI